jgi:hypothetical protein
VKILILKVFYKDEFDLLAINMFHAGKDHFYCTTFDGKTLKSDDLKAWVKIEIIDGGKPVYVRTA